MTMKDWTQDMHKVYLISFSGNKTREEIAKFLGISLERVEKAVEELKKDNTIEEDYEF